MGVMKKILLLAIVALSTVGVAKAVVTPDETLEPGYMMNTGYSELMAADVILAQSRTAGVEAPDIQDKPYYHNPFVKAVRNVFIYLDPALESDYRFHHNIKLTPSYDEL